MAKMTKAQARKRLHEAATKITRVAVEHPEVMSPIQHDKFVKMIGAAIRKLRK